MNATELSQHLLHVSLRRPVFHSEADFQHELALELANAGYMVRLEVPRSITINGTQVRAELDLLVQASGRPTDHKGERAAGQSGWTVIELKYVKVAKVIVHDGETFDLAGTWGTNLSRFDALADLRRVESIVRAGLAAQGHSVFLTNAKDAWSVDVSGQNIMARQFSLHGGRGLQAGAQLDWVPLNPTRQSVSDKRLTPYAPITLARAQTCTWTTYSQFPGRSGEFKYLLLSA